MKACALSLITLCKGFFQSQLVSNVFTNYLAVMWMGGLSILLIPFYLRLLGSQQWGVVAICMSLQSFFNLLDAGLSQIMPRDVAKVAHESSSRYKTYAVYLRVYLALGLIGFVFGQFAVPWLVDHWFSGGKSFDNQDGWAFHLIVLQFLFQFSNNANIGYWNGMQLQTLANFKQCTFGSLKHIGALSLVYFWRADATAYLIPFAAISIFEFLSNHRTINRTFLGIQHDQIYWADYKKLGREAGVLFIGVLIGMLASQMDRIVLSRYVDIAAFGIYVIVANLGLAVMQLQHPLIRAFLPKITLELAGNDKSSFKKLTLGIGLFCILPCIVLSILSRWILQAWIGNPEVVRLGALPLSLFFCAVAFNAAYQLIYQRLLISGRGAVIAKTNLIILMITLPFLLFAVGSLGINAGGFYWLLMSCLQLSFGLIWLHLYK